MRFLVLVAMLLVTIPALADTDHPGAGDRDGYRYSDTHAHGRYR